jgi:hypothetical protein
MDSIGLGGLVTDKGWIELHDPASQKINLQMLNINYKASGKSEDNDFSDTQELRLAFRALKGAMSMVMPWNKSMEALDGFLHETNYCREDTVKLEKRTRILSSFVDYVLKQNASRWRDSRPFLTTGDLKSSWATYFGARSQGNLPEKKGGQHNQNQHNQKQGFGDKSKPKQNSWQRTFSSWNYFPPAAYQQGVCIKFNVGKCAEKGAECSQGNKKFKHTCLAVPDSSKPDVFCGKNHGRHEHK